MMLNMRRMDDVSDSEGLQDSLDGVPDSGVGSSSERTSTVSGKMLAL
jgi:hypothetical protein